MKKLLLPIAFFYHIILSVRHKLYDWHLLKSRHFDRPVISVGNLALGGTGKTPHVEYLIELLSKAYRICVVSRGYGRKTKGFLMVAAGHNAVTVGDEPLQYARKHSDVLVAVDENRNEAIELTEALDYPPEVYLLDDAFQHRSTQAGLNILLTAYDKPYSEDYLIPAGTLRDVHSAAKRADIIIVTKTPEAPDESAQAKVVEKLGILPHQSVFFSSLRYENLRAASPAARLTDPDAADAVLLFCGIACPEPLVKEMKRRYHQVEVVTFPDHHPYSKNDVEELLKRFQKMDGEKKIIITTEKDEARFINSPYLCEFDSVPLFVAPISIKIDKEEKFKLEILDYVRKNS